MTELIQLFVQEMPERIRALQQAWDEQAFDDLRKAAHQLNGCGGGYGFPALGKAAGHLEKTLKFNRDTIPQSALTDARRQLDDLIALCQRVTV